MEPDRRRVAWVPLLRVATAVVLVAVGAAAFAWWPAADEVLAWVDRVRALGWAGMVPFVVAYAVATVLLLPATPFPLSAGFLYGPVVGFAVAWVGEMIGATLAYGLGRSVLRERAAALLARWPVLAALDAALDHEGFQLLLLVRLSPVFPFGPLNYALGMSGVRPLSYVLATGLGTLPMCLLLVWAGSALPRLEAVLSGEEDLGVGTLPYWLGLLATLLAVVAVTRATRRALARAIG